MLRLRFILLASTTFLAANACGGTSTDAGSGGAPATGATAGSGGGSQSETGGASSGGADGAVTGGSGGEPNAGGSPSGGAASGGGHTGGAGGAGSECTDGDTMGDDCNLCTCDDGIWRCSEAACPDICGGFAGFTCDDDEYCAYEEGQECGAGDASASCAPRPTGCTLEIAPVCACDGMTYSNACVAAAAGQGILRAGECD